METASGFSYFISFAQCRMVKTENIQQLSTVLSFETSAGQDISEYI